MLELFQLPLSKRQRVSSNSRTIAKRNLSLFFLLKKKEAAFSTFLPPLTPTTRSFSKLCIFLFTTSLVPSFVRFTLPLPSPRSSRNRSRCSRRRFPLWIETYDKIVEVKRGRSCYFFLYFSSSLSDRSSV